MKPHLCLKIERKCLDNGMNNVKYSFSSVHINLPDPLASDIIHWGRENIPENEVFKNPDDPSFGREDEIHVTVLYGLHSDSPQDTKKVLLTQKPLTIELGKISIFSHEKFDVIKIDINSPELHKLNKKMTDFVTYTNKFKEYTPHVTIAYVKKGKGWKYSGNTVFDGKLFEANEVCFSSRSGKKTKIPLKTV